MKNTYLQRLRAHSKPLFWIVCLHIFCSVIFVHVKFSPMFLQFFLTPTWIMYTRDMPKQGQISFLDLKINGEQQKQPIYLSHKNGVFTYSVNKYATIVENGFRDPAKENYNKPFAQLGIAAPKFIEEKLVNDSSSIARFPSWIKKYLSQNYDVKIDKLEIDMIYANYDVQQNLVIKKKVNLINE